MVQIVPFKGILYNQDIAGEIKLLVTPPYDVISKEEQDRYHRLHPCNIIHLDLGLDYPGDTVSDNRYTRAARLFSEWLSRGVIEKDQEPSLYLYEMEYPFSGEKRVLRGFICLVRLEDPGSEEILLHEATYPKPKSDRLNLLRACNATFSQIFAMYSDPRESILGLLYSQIDEGNPRIGFTDDKGITHRIWSISDRGVIQKVVEEFKEKKVFIADGHHRYETALAYKNEAGYNYTMMYLSSMEQSGLTIMPTHRLLKGPSVIPYEKLLERLKEFFYIEFFHFDKGSELEQWDRMLSELERRGRKGHVFGMYYGGINRYVLLEMKEGAFTIEEEYPVTLDVAVFQRMILNKVFVIKEVENNEDTVGYVQDALEAIRMVKEKEFKVAFILNPTRSSDITAVATAKKRMPQKSTYFYPKPLTGLVIHQLKG